MASSAMSSGTPSRLMSVRAVRRRSCRVKSTPLACCSLATSFVQPLMRPVCTLVRSSEGCPSKPAVSHARRRRSMQASGEKPRWTSAVSGRWTRSDVAREELPHQAHCRAAAVERAHLHEAVRYSFHHV